MRKALALLTLSLLAAALGSCGRTYTCDIYHYESFDGAYIWDYSDSEEYYGTSAEAAEDACESNYNAFYDCQNCR